MKYCENCGAELDDDKQYCDTCGVPQSEVEKPMKKPLVKSADNKNKNLFKVLAAVLVISVGAAVLFYVTANNGKNGADFKNENRNTELVLKEPVLTEEPKPTETPEPTQEIESMQKPIPTTAVKPIDEPVVDIKKVQEAYRNILNLEKVKEDSARERGKEYYSFYTLGDVNQDGTGELMIEAGTCEADEKWIVYSYKEDSAYQMGEMESGHSRLCSGQDGNIYSFNAQMGSVDISKILWNDGTNTFDTESIYTNETNDFMADDYDTILQTFDLAYKDMKKITDYSFLGGGKAEDTKKLNNSEIIQLPEGSYWEEDKSPSGAMYYIELSGCTSEGFDFEIFGRFNMDENFSTVFKHHTAIYTSYQTAAYYGKQYTLLFNWEEQGYLSVEGFPEWIPKDSILYNSDFLGVS